MKGGQLVQYTNKDGKVQKGRLMYDDQSEEFSSRKKALIRLCTDDFEDQLRDGKKEITLVQIDKLTVIGYID